MLKVSTLMESKKLSNQEINNKLCKEYLSVAMEKYFYRKLRNEDPIYVRLKISEILKYFLLAEHTRGPIPFTSELDMPQHFHL